jgi:hydroxymethylglutaryl-CoA reductase
MLQVEIFAGTDTTAINKFLATLSEDQLVSQMVISEAGYTDNVLFTYRKNSPAKEEVLQNLDKMRHTFATFKSMMDKPFGNASVDRLRATADAYGANAAQWNKMEELADQMERKSPNTTYEGCLAIMVNILKRNGPLFFDDAEVKTFEDVMAKDLAEAFLAKLGLSEL